MPEAFDLLDQSRRRNTVDGSFPRGIDVEDQHNIRKIESAGKIIEEMKRSRETMWLENGKNALEVRALGCAERSPDFRGVMGIIVYHRHTVARLDLEPPVDSFETVESCGDDGSFDVHVAGRRFSDESEAEVRAGYARLFGELGIAIDAQSPVSLVLFPEMDARVDVPEITTACWGILKKSPDSVMCASARMVVKRKGAMRPAVVACTLLPYDPQFELGHTLSESVGAVRLNHPHCAKFCVLGGAACSQ